MSNPYGQHIHPELPPARPCLLQYIIGMDPRNVRDILKASNFWAERDGSLPALDEVGLPD